MRFVYKEQNCINDKLESALYLYKGVKHFFILNGRPVFGEEIWELFLNN